MPKKELTPKIRRILLGFQEVEITEYLIYKKLAKSVKNKNNAKILNEIAISEMHHYKIWKSYTKKKVKPRMAKVWFYYILARVFGLTFGIKLMEREEQGAQKKYEAVRGVVPQAKKIEDEEHAHESQLIAMINEDKLNYLGSMVLGLNDAIVELTGALAGLTLAFARADLIALAGLITGIAASFSMGASEYLATKSEDDHKNPLKASIYTGVAYILAVFILIAPYFIFSNVFVALGSTLAAAIAIIFIFTYYVSVAQDLNFKKRFGEMALISLGIATLTFLISYLIKGFFNIEL